MSETVKDLVSKVQDMVPEIESEIPTASDGALNLLVIGNPQQNLFGALNEIIGDLDPLDYPMMSGYRGTIVYGEHEAVFQTDSGTPVASDLESVSEALKRYNKNSVQYQFTIVLNHPLLEGCTIHVLASDSDFEDINWNAELSSCDYLLLTMSSTALLSMAERKVIRNWLVPHMSGFYGVILTNDNLILEDDRKDIDASLDNMFHGDVDIFRTPETDTQRLADTLRGMKEDVVELHAKRAARAERLLLMNAKRAVEIQMEVLSENSSGIEEAVEAIKESVQKLPGRQKSALRHVRIQYITPSRLDVMQRVNEFQQELNEKLKAEIEQGENPGDMSEILPFYIADAWKGEAEILFENMQARTAAMQKDLHIYIEKDIRNYIESCVGGNRADYVYALTEKYFNLEDSFAFHDADNQFLYDAPKDDTKAKYYGVIASGVALILFSHPIIGAAVAAFGSKKVKKSSEMQLEQKTREALITACKDLNREYSNDTICWIDSVFRSIEENIAASIDECYQKMIDSIVQAMNKRMNDKNNYDERLSELQALKDEIEKKLAV